MAAEDLKNQSDLYLLWLDGLAAIDNVKTFCTVILTQIKNIRLNPVYATSLSNAQKTRLNQLETLVTNFQSQLP